MAASRAEADRGGYEENLIRAVRENPGAEELAGLTAVLLPRTAAGAEPDDISRRQRAVATWRRPDRTPGPALSTQLSRMTPPPQEPWARAAE